jgi:FkbM family methyltransferase
MTELPADGAVARVLWRGLVAAGRVTGPRPARSVAALAMRAGAARGDEGWTAGVHRVAGRDTGAAVVKPPPGWWTTRPLVRVRRLGLTWELDLRDNLERVLWCTGTYEPALLRYLAAELRAGDVVADIGAHIGVHSLTAAARLRALGGGRVLSFEPARDSADRLRAGAAANGLDHLVTLAETALGAGPGTARLVADAVYDEADAGVRSLHGTGQVVQEVPVTTFDAWADGAGLDRLDVVKLDVEGAELDVLRGMRATLTTLRPRVLVAEVKQRILDRAGVGADELRGFLADAGYIPSGTAFDANEVFTPQTR